MESVREQSEQQETSEISNYDTARESRRYSIHSQQRAVYATVLVRFQEHKNEHEPMTAPEICLDSVFRSPLLALFLALYYIIYISSSLVLTPWLLVCMLLLSNTRQQCNCASAGVMVRI